jgi:DNA polymerase III subunit chi
MVCVCSIVSSPIISKLESTRVSRVDFYRLTRDPVERVLPAIAGKILGGQARLLVVAASEAQRRAIDEALWAVPPVGFLPHGPADGPDAANDPILIAASLDDPPANGAANVALADGEWNDDALAFDRAFLFFDNSRIDDARATWRKLGAMDDVETHFWKQDDQGRWSEGP